MMTVTVNLSKLPYLGEASKLEILNRLFKSREAIMLHELATATGYSREESMQLLMFLYDLRLIKPFLLVYHKEHLDVPIQTRDLLEGFPPVPFTCPECEREITQKDQLSYDFLFKTVEPEISFVNDLL